MELSGMEAGYDCTREREEIDRRIDELRGEILAEFGIAWEPRKPRPTEGAA